MEYGSMVTLKKDRMTVMFGGQYGEILSDQFWTYNVNTNLW